MASHPDDEVLGCGGTVAKLVKNDAELYTLILGQGIASRYEENGKKKIKKEKEELRKHMYAANNILGTKEVFPYDFPDNKFDTVGLLEIVRAVEKVKNKINPDIIFTHYEKDLNIDHQVTYKAVITAVRPLPNEPVKEIYSFEVLSSTEWGYPTTFAPNVFFDISDTIDIKTKVVSEYKSELREFPHPRSLHAVRLNAEYWAMRVGVKYAEAFKAVRIIK